MKHLGPWVSVSILGARHFDWASIPENFCVELPRAGGSQAGSVDPARPGAVGRDLALPGD